MRRYVDMREKNKRRNKIGTGLEMGSITYDSPVVRGYQQPRHRVR